jgi:hypothetical protein
MPSRLYAHFHLTASVPISPKLDTSSIIEVLHSYNPEFADLPHSHTDRVVSFLIRLLLLTAAYPDTFVLDTDRLAAVIVNNNYISLALAVFDDGFLRPHPNTTALFAAILSKDKSTDIDSDTYPDTARNLVAQCARHLSPTISTTHFHITNSAQFLRISEIPAETLNAIHAIFHFPRMSIAASDYLAYFADEDHQGESALFKHNKNTDKLVNTIATAAHLPATTIRATHSRAQIIRRAMLLAARFPHIETALLAAYPATFKLMQYQASNLVL